MANNSIILSNLDFDRLKNTFKTYLRGQDRFKDYDFESSNLNVLLDLLSYNTYMNSFYLNMIGNEMFLDTAQLRDSVVSHSKELNYIPGSFTSSRVSVSLFVPPLDPAKRNLFIPKGTQFTSRTLDNKDYTFVTDRNITITTKDQVGRFFMEGINLYEGSYVSDSYTVVPGSNIRYLVTNPTVDISSVSVTVMEDLGTTVQEYTKADTLFGLNENSKAFFVQGAENNTYEILFGDGVIGRKPKNNSVVVIEYRACSGELPNGLSSFKNTGTIDGETNIQVIPDGKSAGGSVSETLESIKFNAPRAFSTQERAVTTEDFESLLKINFPEINAVSAYGGEELDPPQFGKVFVAIDLKETDRLPQTKIDEYYRYLKPRSVVSIDPVFVNPDYVYVAVRCNISYNINTTSLNQDDIRSLALDSIVKYAQTSLNNFNKTLRYSKLVNIIDNSSSGIVSNQTEVVGVKYLSPMLNTKSNFQLNFGYPFKKLTTPVTGSRASVEEHIVISTYMTYNGQRVYIEDDGEGNLEYIALGSGNSMTGGNVVLGRAGRVDYDGGIIYLDNFIVSDFEGGKIKFYATPRSRDINSSKDTILNIIDEDVTVNITEIRE